MSDSGFVPEHEWGFAPAATILVAPSELDSTSDALSDEALLSAMANGEPDALGQFYDRYARLAMAVAFRVLSDHGLAEDAVQTAFLSAWRNAANFDRCRGSVRTWLLTIVRNSAVDRRRRQQTSAWQDLPLDHMAFRLSSETDEPFAAAAARLEAERMHSVLASLPLTQRTAIELAYFGGLTHREIAARTGTPLGTIKGRLRLGLRTLRVSLADLLLREDLVRHGDCASPGAGC